MLSTVDYNGEEALKSCHSEFHRIIRRNPIIKRSRPQGGFVSYIKEILSERYKNPTDFLRDYSVFIVHLPFGICGSGGNGVHEVQGFAHFVHGGSDFRFE